MARRWEENNKNQSVSLLPAMDNVSFEDNDAHYVRVNIDVTDYLNFC